MPTTPAARSDLARITLSVLAFCVLIAGSLYVLRPFLLPLIWATTLVVATWPLLLRLQSWLGGKRGAAVAALTVVLLLVLFVPLYLCFSTIMAQSDRIAELVRALPSLTIPPPPPWLEGLPIVGRKATAKWSELAALDPAQLHEQIAPFVRSGFAWFAAWAGGFGGMVLNFIITVVISAILYARGERAAENVRRFFRRLSGERGDVIVTLAGKAIRAVALGVVVTALVQTAIAAIGLVLVGFPFAALIAAVALVLCIAQLGPLLALAPCVVLLYATGSPGRGTVLLVAMVLGQTIDQVLRPFLIKKGGADLSLVLIIAGVVGGLLWLGVIGLFVGPVILAVASMLLDSWISSGLGETTAAPGPTTIPSSTAEGDGSGRVSVPGMDLGASKPR
jgi:predicted PurR-regulated permease PerM